ncbi:MAG: Inorganic triphosphatase [uncultured Sphingomonas sp.]|uniref:Inorganic triphosphatase n=1 Tax=uncultured Sphingomonas sp. TaxID=158754 RepID=A0A6J4TE60_9SPHN|nr:CHAD domain-containing protein [uncultured Sphingomonas sp.]CAA9521072.1 MAG: Inorganic triphosphatase [uncultured Sphingomonas sp.]
MGKEIELKLDLVGDQSALVRSDPLFQEAESRTARQTSVYYDTPKKLLAKNGFSLRVRRSGEAFVQTLKRTVSSDGLFTRDEWEWEVPSEALDCGKLDGLPVELPTEAEKLGRKLQPVLRSEVERTSWRLRQGSSNVQVDWDVGRLTADRQCLDFAEIEFELLEGTAADVVAAARALAERVPARLGVLSKAERGAALADGALDRVAKAAPVSITPDLTVAEAFAAIMHACLKHYRLNEQLVIRSRPADALHQARVALRRLRSAFSFFRPAIADDRYLRLREDLRWFTAQLGDARNLDVYLQRELDGGERAAAGRRREQAYDQVVEAMNATKLRLLLIDLTGWAAIGPWRSGKLADRSIRGFARKRLDKLWATIAPTRGLLAQMDEDSRHRLRIQIKKLRYAVEFFRDVYPRTKRRKRFTEAVEGLQEALGKLNDLATARLLAPELTGQAPQESAEETDNLRAAESFLEQLCDAGPFWQSAKA